MEKNEQNVETSPDTTEETSEATETAATTAHPEEDEAVQKTKEMLQQLAAQGKKPVLFIPPLSGQSTDLLNTSLAQLSALRDKIGTIRSTVNTQNDHINGRLEKLQDNPILKIDGENKQAKESVAQYTQLLDRIVEEVTYEEKLLNDYAKLEKQTIVPVWAHEPDDFDQFIRFKVNRVKKQTKKIEKDLDVSFSRYQFSFDRQCKHLENVEQFVTYNMKLREAQAKATKDAPKKEAEKTEDK